MKHYDIFLFHADGTLYDYDMAEAAALKTMFAHCGFAYSESIRTKYKKINAMAWASYEKGEISKAAFQTMRFKQLFEEIGVAYDAVEFNKRYLYELGRGGQLIDGALEICREIYSCNKKIYIVTNGILATQQSRIENSLIETYVSDFFVAEFVGFHKPHISYFDYVFQHIPKVEKSRILIIGDSLSADIAGGNNAGIDSCWFNATGMKNEAEAVVPTYEISTLYELRQFYK